MRTLFFPLSFYLCLLSSCASVHNNSPIKTSQEQECDVDYTQPIKGQIAYFDGMLFRQQHCSKLYKLRFEDERPLQEIITALDLNPAHHIEDFIYVNIEFMGKESLEGRISVIKLIKAEQAEVALFNFD